MKKLIILALAMLTISLTGCGTTTPAAAPAVVLPAYYVNAATGLDTNAGTQAAPFKTITKALATASTGISLNIFVAPGTYNAANGEVFPLKIASTGINLIGTGTPLISGTGNYKPAAGNMSGWTLPFAVAITPGVTATMQGFAINGSQETICIDGATATLTNNTASGSTDIAVWICDNANATLTNNTINNGGWSVLVADASTTAKLRGNTINTPTMHSIVVGYATPVPTTAIDLGTAANPGNNIIQGGLGGVGLYLKVVTAGGNVNASGNTWKVTQGADPQGHYPAGLLIAPGTALVAGSNYANAPNGGIQFYSQAGGAGNQASY